MKRLFFNRRYWLTAAMFFTGMVLLVCEVSDGYPFLTLLVLTRLLGIALMACSGCLYEKWAADGKLPTLNELLNGMDDGSDD